MRPFHRGSSHILTNFLLMGYMLCIVIFDLNMFLGSLPIFLCFNSYIIFLICLGKKKKDFTKLLFTTC